MQDRRLLWVFAIVGLLVLPNSWASDSATDPGEQVRQADAFFQEFHKEPKTAIDDPVPPRAAGEDQSSSRSEATRGSALSLDPRPLTEVLGHGRGYALVIGINAYQHLNKLKTAVADATAVAQVLEDSYGFRVQLITDERATRDGIVRALNELRRELTPDDRLLLYYAGHGEYTPETDTAYWLPVDAEANDNTNWIGSKSVSDQLRLISARQVLVVADSCYSGTMTRDAGASLRSGDTRENYLKKLLAKPARVLLASGGNEPVSDGGGQGHSIFADVFLRALQDPGREVFTAEELHVLHLKESVAGRAAQTPEYRIIRDSGHDGGDFVFSRRR